MLSDEIRQEILARGDWKAKTRGERLHFRCPRHEDGTPSAWQAGGAWGCFACGFEEPITTLAGELGIPLAGGGARSGYSLEDYADAKGFSAPQLRSWGLETFEEPGRSRNVVRIPYFDEDGHELRARFRSRTKKWWEGKNQPIFLYGRDHLLDAKPGDSVLIVEGESDCHALWSAGILAVGVPGATSWRPEWKEHLLGLVPYVWEEPDQGGAQMVERIVRDFPDAKILRHPSAKDPCDLRQRLGDTFASEIARMMSEARAHGAHEPPVPFVLLAAPRFEQLLEQQLTPVEAVPTPFPIWNRHCRDDGGGIGLAMGWHVLGAARTGVGKSILALNAAAAAMRSGETVCFVSLEMSQRQVEVRLMSILSGIAVSRLEKGPAFEVQAFREAARLVGQIPGKFMTNSARIRKLPDIEGAIRAVHETHGARLFIVDYLQLAGNANDPESIAAVSQTVREQAAELQVVTFGLSQFNRLTSTVNETPGIHGLMGGSALENDSDQVVLVDHSKMENASDGGWTTNLLLAKNRHGGTGAVPIHFSKATLRMRELLDDEIPANLVGSH